MERCRSLEHPIKQCQKTTDTDIYFSPLYRRRFENYFSSPSIKVQRWRAHKSHDLLDKFVSRRWRRTSWYVICVLLLFHNSMYHFIWVCHNTISYVLFTVLLCYCLLLQCNIYCTMYDFVIDRGLLISRRFWDRWREGIRTVDDIPFTKSINPFFLVFWVNIYIYIYICMYMIQKRLGMKFVKSECLLKITKDAFTQFLELISLSQF